MSPVRARVVSASAKHTVIIDDDARVWVTGANSHGQLGFGETRIQPHFVQVAGMAARAVDTSENLTAVLDLNGRVWLAGEYPRGDRSGFAQAELDATAIAAGWDVAYIVDTSGRVQVTSPAGWDVISPAGVEFRTVRAGGHHLVAFDTGDGVWVYGRYHNRHYRHDTVTRVGGLLGLDAATGPTHTALIGLDHRLWVAGHNDNGQLGDGRRPAPGQFTDVAYVHAAQVAVGETHTLCLGLDGRLWGAGHASHYGQFGSGRTRGSAGPKQDLPRHLNARTAVREAPFLPLHDARGHTISASLQIATSSGHTVLVDEGGSVRMSGEGGHGQLGCGTASTGEFTPVELGTPAAQLAGALADDTTPAREAYTRAGAAYA